MAVYNSKLGLRIEMRRQLYLIVAGIVFGFMDMQVRAMDANLGNFLYSKQQQIHSFADAITVKVPHIVWSFYDAVAADDWETASNLFGRINAASRRFSEATNDESASSAFDTMLWPPISESDGACEQFRKWNNHWLHRYGNDVINSIPPGSIYFGGTDSGRFIISALCESQVTGRPFFTLTQNQLADSAYLDYLHAMYGKKITVPTNDDLQRAFQEYAADVARRREQGLLKPGEDVKMVNGQVQISGPAAVMAINGLLARTIFDHNRDRQFFIEESSPVDWMYPYLTPHGLIFQLNSKPQPQITEAQMREDERYWKKFTDEALGPWLDEKTSLNEVCNFARKYGLGEELVGYRGDKDFAASSQARKCYSKLRSSMAGLYVWRADNATDPQERQRMYDAADYAFRQSFALYPCAPDVVYRYVDLLLERNRNDDALMVVKTVLRLMPGNVHLKDLLVQVEKAQ